MGRTKLIRLLQSPSSRAVVVTAVTCVAYLAAVKGCSDFQVELYKDAIPAEFELDHIIYHDGTSGFREGCGVAIFKVSQRTLARFGREGDVFLSSATLGRVKKPDHQYQSWRATPPPSGVYVLQGGAAGCIDSPPPVWREITEAAREGGFFTIGPEKDLLFVPKLGILVFSHSG